MILLFGKQSVLSGSVMNFVSEYISITIRKFGDYGILGQDHGKLGNCGIILNR